MNKKTKWKQIQALAWPILLNYLLITLFEVMDKAIVGHYSVQSFAVVGIAAAPIFEITGALGILSAAFNILAARQRGQKDEEAFERTFLVSRELALIIGTGFFLLSLLFGRPFFRVFYGQTGSALEELLRYFYPASVTVLQNMLIFQYSAYYRNRLDAKISFYSTAISTVVNLFFDLTLVHGLFGLPRLGAAGAAWGSVIGLAAGLFVFQAFFFRHRTKPALTPELRREVLQTLFRLYPPLLGQEFMESTLFVLVISGVVARLGTGQIALYSLLTTVSSLLALPIYAFSTATQTYACQSRASGDAASARRYLLVGQSMALAALGGLCILCQVFQTQVLGLVVSDGTVIAGAGALLGWIFAYLAVKTLCHFSMGYLQGTGREKYVFFSTAVATIAASISAIGLASQLGLPGVYLVMILESLVLALVYRLKMRDM